MLTLSPDSLLVKILSKQVPVFSLMFKYCVVLATWAVGFTALALVFPNEKSVWRRLLTMSRLEGVSGCVFGLMNILLNYAFYEENIGIVLVILAVHPAFASVFSHVLKETTPLRTIITCGICITCVVFICWENLTGEEEGSALGILASLGASVTYGLYFVLLRMVSSQSKHEDEMQEEGGGGNDIRLILQIAPCNIVASVFVVVVCGCFVRDVGDMNTFGGMMLFVQGVLVIPFSFLLMTVGPAYIPAYEVSLIVLIEVVLGPLFVWLGGFEAPTMSAFVGGGVIMVTLSVNSYLSMRQSSNSEFNKQSKVETKDSGPMETKCVSKENDLPEHTPAVYFVNTALVHPVEIEDNSLEVDKLKV